MRELFQCFDVELGIDFICFEWLVADWRRCWAGDCLTARKTFEEESRILNKSLPKAPTGLRNLGKDSKQMIHIGIAY